MMWDDDFTPDVSGYWQEPDFLLADLVSAFVNHGGMPLGITVFVKGMVITGTLVSEGEYLSTMSKIFTKQARKSLLHPTAEELKATEELFDFTRLTEDDRASGGEDKDADQEDDVDNFWDDDDVHVPTIRHMHLKDPVILQPQSSISFSHSQLPIMRIRLTAVDGWMMGKVTLDDTMDDFSLPPNEVRH
ncbi:MAG: hypothetical protein HXY41_09565 [Chloroflexi bacterium]|nr:hypothetical protein [Chloroflexota bacterium]